MSLERWKIAQVVEGKAIRGRKTRWEPENYDAFLEEWFKVNYGFFSGKRVLEIGCGAYGMIYYIDAPCLKVGADPLCLHYSDLYQNPTNLPIHRVNAAGEYLPLKDKLFDVVLCINVLDHTLSPIPVIKEAKRVLREQGKLFLFINTFALPKIIRGFLGTFDRPHPIHFSGKEIEELGNNEGFKIIYKKSKPVSIVRGMSIIKNLEFIHGFKYVVGALLRLREAAYILER